jgi:hypothetical protein
LIDNEPIGGVSISFTPADGTKGTGGFGATDSTGAYSLKHRSGAVGIEPGEYKVVISRYAQPDGSPIPAGKSAADVGAVELLPASYSSVEETTLTATVPSKGTDAQDFQLSSR